MFDELTDVVNTMSEVLSITTRKLKHITQGRKFSKKPGFQKRGVLVHCSAPAKISKVEVGQC